MGSRSKTSLAYIAGFLDGDGSLMLQVKKRKDGDIGIRFMATICFYQDSRHSEALFWIRDVLGIGYLSKRNDGMSELRINGYKQVWRILSDLLPYIRFKKIQAKALFDACVILRKGAIRKLTKRQLENLVNIILVIQNQNYATKKKKSRLELLKILDLTP